MTHTLSTRFRTLLLLGVTLLALAMSGTAAFAGEDDDGDDEDDAPAPTQVAPAPVPVKPAPAPAQRAPAAQPQSKPAPAPAQPAPAAQPQSKPASHSQAQHVSSSRRSTTTVQAGQVIPRGGVETGAGGTATTFTDAGPSPLLVGMGALLAFLLLGRGVRLAHASR